MIGVGMWIAIIMWFNVWFIIWPNQKKALASSRSSRRQSQGGPCRHADFAHQHRAVGADVAGHDGADHLS